MTALKLGLVLAVGGLASPLAAHTLTLDQASGKPGAVSSPPPVPAVVVPPPAPPRTSTAPRPRPVAQGPAQPLPSIALGQTLNERVADDGRCVLDPSARFYQFRAEPNTRIEITLRSQSFDPVVEIGRVNGCEFDSLGRNDDGSGVNDGNNSRLVGTLVEGGTYVIRASAYGSRSISGSYRLALQQLPTEAPRATSTRPIALTAGRSANGSLDSSDPAITTTRGSTNGFIERSADRPYHLYSLAGRAGQSYEIRLDSSDFDAFLESGAMTPMGFAVLDSNDDGPDAGRNSRLTVRFPVNGTITLRVSPLGRGSGRYTISAVQSANN